MFTTSTAQTVKTQNGGAHGRVSATIKRRFLTNQIVHQWGKKKCFKLLFPPSHTPPPHPYPQPALPISIDRIRDASSLCVSRQIPKLSLRSCYTCVTSHFPLQTTGHGMAWWLMDWFARALMLLVFPFARLGSETFLACCGISPCYICVWTELVDVTLV